MACPICGADAVTKETRDLEYSYKGQVTVIPHVTGTFCSACGEAILEGEESERVSAAMLAFNREVNASFVDPEYIAKVRKKLSLDQREAGDLFGGGVNAFSRYENGKSRPPRSLIQLLKILEKHPDLLDEIKAA
ncbi:type II toxin-antitoxin system MqsA family antitoxin [Agrobacterium larrymoorei]|uniref:Type II toxin-antitoxin system MqsA family antitoxin n=1 Tax=Agrobacterium larrymoorei TaxID=160699 RepID=A0AAF0KD57_9HYPH|nr:type II toxin-antitoxin system MqsA family antitoxin [Agrobacterium larrymoorei]WHA40376.1 type II toxin-antitoxin system MqsA family antitoxin [Agrobacterium larrymoorei]